MDKYDIFKIIRKHDIDRLREAITIGCDLNVRESTEPFFTPFLDRGAKKTIDKAEGFAGMNALGIAVNCLNIPMIKILLEAGANPEIIDYDRRKPIARLPKNADPKIKKQIENLLNHFSQKSLAIADRMS